MTQKPAVAAAAAATAAVAPAAPTAAAIAFDRLVQRLEAAFSAGGAAAPGDPSRKGSSASVLPPSLVKGKVLLTKLDEQAADVLFDLDRTLTTCDRVRLKTAL